MDPGGTLSLVPGLPPVTSPLAPTGLGAGRTALISDIHGDLAGLLAVLADIARRGCDRIFCLGDLIGHGPQADNPEVIRILRERGIPAVRGNHDRPHHHQLPAEDSAFLDALPDTLEDGDCLYTHISPRRHRLRRVDDPREAGEVLAECRHRLIFLGHTHIPFVFSARRGSGGPAQSHPIFHNRPYPLHREERYVICVGPVTTGRDRIHRPRYQIHDHGAQTIEIALPP